MKKLIAIFVLSALAAGCSQTNAITGSSVTAQVSQVNGVNSVTVGTTPVTAASLALPPGYSTNSASLPTAYPYANPVWSTNLKVATPPPAGTITANPIISTNVPGVFAPATNVPITSANQPIVVVPAVGAVSTQTTGGAASVTVGPNGTIIAPSTTTPGITLTPTGAAITPATGN